jgi:hypothetical protein
MSQALYTPVFIAFGKRVTVSISIYDRTSPGNYRDVSVFEYDSDNSSPDDGLPSDKDGLKRLLWESCDALAGALQHYAESGVVLSNAQNQFVQTVREEYLGLEWMLAHGYGEDCRAVLEMLEALFLVSNDRKCAPLYLNERHW